MMSSALEQARHAQERGDILRTLLADYSREMTSTTSLRRTLDFLLVPLSNDSLQFHLVYLSQQDYVQVWRGRDLPGARTDRQQHGDPNTILFVKLRAKGMQLLEGQIASDPMVAF